MKQRNQTGGRMAIPLLAASLVLALAGCRHPAEASRGGADATPQSSADASNAPSRTRTAAPRDKQVQSDRAISDEVRARLRAGAIEPERVRVNTVDGVVELEGTVRDESERDRALRSAKDVPGVSAVSDKLRTAAAAPAR